MKLSNRIRILRISKGLSQEFIADKMGISQAAYSRIENNAEHSSFLTLSRVAKALDLPLKYLLDIDEI